MPKARARLCPTISITRQPTIASRICVSITGAWRGGAPRRRGRNASAAPSSAARGSRTAASARPGSWSSRTGTGGSFQSGGSAAAADDAHKRANATSFHATAVRALVTARSVSSARLRDFLQYVHECRHLGVAVAGGVECVPQLLVAERETVARPQYVVHLRPVGDAR